MVSRLEDMVGKRSTDLVVVSLSRILKGKRLWLCKCACGRKREASTSALNSGQAKSCGCLRGNPLPPGEASFNELFSNYSRRANEHGLSFRLSKKRFRALVQDNCRYCGTFPLNVHKKNQANGEFVYNGIDRVDNRYGYSVNNCVSCCKTCNWAKGTMNLTEFKSWIERITAHQGK